MPDKPTALILYALPGETAGTVTAHIRALETLKDFDCRALNIAWQLPMRLDLDRFDVVIVHYTLMASESPDGPMSLSAESATRLSRSQALKCVFVQDEHRNVNGAISALRTLRADVFFTCMPERFVADVYPATALTNIKAVNVLTGYVDEGLLCHNVLPFVERPIDVGYRARKVAYWLGELAHEKWTIAERFAPDAREYGLVYDISTREQDRIYGDDWVYFLGQCKAVLGTESGASVVDIDGSIRRAVDAAVAENPSLTFEEARARFFRDVDGRFSMAQISPRCFEAAAMRTLMILYAGDYSGRLEPYRHYVPLHKDHSNMSEVVGILRDPDRAQTIIENAYRECALNPKNSHKALQDTVEGAIFARMPLDRRTRAYSEADWSAIKADNRKILDRARRFRAANAALSQVISRILPGGSGIALRDRIAKPLRAALLRR